MSEIKILSDVAKRQLRLNYIQRDCTDVQKVDVDNVFGLEMYTFNNKLGKPSLLAFKGKSWKPFIYCYYRQVADRQKALDEAIERAKNDMNEKVNKKLEAEAFVHDYVVGDILTASWGYDQTNISAFKVIGRTDHSVKLVEIGLKHLPSDHEYSDTVIPDPNIQEEGKPMLRKVNARGGVKIASYMYASKWDGQPEHQTASGYGH